MLQSRGSLRVGHNLATEQQHRTRLKGWDVMCGEAFEASQSLPGSLLDHLFGGGHPPQVRTVSMERSTSRGNGSS